ncbi:class I tRNA ligase family protein [Acetivibrio saccincola]|jgi:methionyl-tRNA synthetase|uniref:class I tRNA ligase family protein n=1 Tax=Acetivibrio saccincola TaxID=1677857 RepID=UPI0016907FC5|nr:class I tRNA ligase family protein [Acetivibrio saccincola]NLW26322.1 class I tRNA ligase family protein [Acetivibrio saccincola]
MKKSIITTAAFPFIPAEINIAHMASTYIPADVYNRFMNLFGNDAFLVCATDVHGVWVKRELKKSDTDIKSLVDSFHNKYLKIFESLNIKFSNYGRTDSKLLYDLVNDSLVTLKENGFINKKVSKIYYCNQCLEYLPKRFRIESSGTTQTGKLKLDDSDDKNMVCGFCMSHDVEEVETEHWFMDIPKGVDLIKNEVDKQKDSRVKKYLQSVINNGLSEWDFTRDDYYGIRLPFGTKNQYVYLWYDSLVGYLSLVPTGQAMDKVAYRHFLGKNIIYYHGIVWPLILKKGFNFDSIDFQISARGFLNLSATDKELIDVEEAVCNYEPDYLRFYVAHRTPDSFNDFVFTINELKETVNNILCRQVGGFFNRCRSILRNNNVLSVPENGVRNEIFEETLSRINTYISDMEINKALLEVIGYIKKCGNVINKQCIYKNPSQEQLELLCKMMAGGLLLIAPFIPGIVENYNIFDGFKLDNIKNIEFLQGKKITYTDSTWRQIND